MAIDDVLWYGACRARDRAQVKILSEMVSLAEAELSKPIYMRMSYSDYLAKRRDLQARKDAAGTVMLSHRQENTALQMIRSNDRSAWYRAFNFVSHVHHPRIWYAHARASRLASTGRASTAAEAAAEAVLRHQTRIPFLCPSLSAHTHSA